MSDFFQNIDPEEQQKHFDQQLRRQLWIDAYLTSAKLSNHSPILDANQALVAFDAQFIDQGKGKESVPSKKHATLEELDGGYTVFNQNTNPHYYIALRDWVYENKLQSLTAKRLKQTFEENNILPSLALFWTVKSVQTFKSRYLV
jgi:hypothetical protein